jgi:hypothetical protein
MDVEDDIWTKAITFQQAVVDKEEKKETYEH